MSRINEADTKHAPIISETATDALYNSIVRIETQQLIGTGFFLKKQIKNEFKYFLFTCEHVITKDDFNSKIAINLHYGKKNNEKKKKIVLDNKKRFIACFGGEKDVTVIEILKSDDIPEDKYLLADLNYKYGYNKYKNGKFFLAGYPNDPIYHKERHISSGEIKSIEGFEFEHSIDTRAGSSGAPICFIENLGVIGIHKQGNTKKSINYGTFIGVILDDLEKIYKEINSVDDNKEKQNNIINNEIKNDNLYNDFNIESKNPIKILNYHTDRISSLTVMNDGRLISGSWDNSIIIYNKETYNPDLIIKEHNDPVYCIIQLSSGILASCSRDKSIKLFHIKGNKYEVLQTLNFHTEPVYEIIELKSKTLASCSNDNTIIFYIKDNLKYKKDHQISTNEYCSKIIQTKDNEICYNEENNDTIFFYDLLERKVKASISKISTLNMIMMTKDLLLTVGHKKISIINANNYKLVRIIDVQEVGFIFGVCMLNKNLLLTGNYTKIIRQWRIEGDNLIPVSKKEKAHDDGISVLLNLGNGHIASGSFDKIIKIW